MVALGCEPWSGRLDGNPHPLFSDRKTMDPPPIENASSRAPSSHDLQELFDAYGDNLYRFAYSLTHQEAHARDLLQDTFLQYARKGAGLRDPQKARGWLFTTMYRLFLRQKERSRRESPHDEDLLGAELPPVESDPSRAMDARRALAALTRLEEKYRAPLTLFYLQELTYREIADVLGIPLGTVMSRIARARELLTEAFHGAWSTEEGDRQP